MIQPSKNVHLLIAGSLASLLLGTGFLGVAFKTQAQDSVSKSQETALAIVTKMTEGQRSYYQKNGKFNVVVKDMAKELSLTLPSSFNYGVRTSVDAAYIYVIPAQTPEADQLKAYVGGAFLNPKQNTKMFTIICESTKPGRLRPSDPKVLRGKDSSPSTPLVLECGDFSVQVPSSQKNG